MKRHLFALLLLAASVPPTLGQTTVIRAGRLIDKDGVVFRNESAARP